MIRKKEKVCWVARETAQGWRLKLSSNSRDYPLRGALFATREDVKKVTGDMLGVVFIHLADSQDEAA